MTKTFNICDIWMKCNNVDANQTCVKAKRTVGDVLKDDSSEFELLTGGLKENTPLHLNGVF